MPAEKTSIPDGQYPTKGLGIQGLGKEEAFSQHGTKCCLKAVLLAAGYKSFLTCQWSLPEIH